MTGREGTLEEVWAALAKVTDPEIPVVSLEELGILRDVALEEDRVIVTITPTYSGCPAMDEIERDVLQALTGGGWERAEVRRALAPAWSTDFITETGLQKLQAYGIAPPERIGNRPVMVQLGQRRLPPCPQCGSEAVEETSRFSSTSCKSLMRCLTCREPFEHMRPY